MDGFINFLDEYKTLDDEKTIVVFKEKLNTPVEYKDHLKNFVFTEKWFSTLDNILVELGYRALDADIKIIRKEIKRRLVNRNSLKIEYLYKNKEFIEWMIQHHLYKIDIKLLSHCKFDIDIKYIDKKIKDKIDYDHKMYIYQSPSWIELYSLLPWIFDNGKSWITKLDDYYEEKCRFNNSIFATDDLFDRTQSTETITQDIIVLNLWKFHKFNQLNWLPRSRIIIDNTEDGGWRRIYTKMEWGEYRCINDTYHKI